jgi:hypothetical protein
MPNPAVVLTLQGFSAIIRLMCLPVGTPILLTREG